MRRVANREEYEDVMARFRIKEETQVEEEEQQDKESETEGGI